MSLLTSCAPHPALADHPEFPFMLACTLERFRCTVAEVREDYWLGRAWRALSGDHALSSRVARVGFGNVLLTGPEFGPALPGARERERWRKRVMERLMVDTGRSAEALGLEIRFAEEPIEITEGSMHSLIAQTVLGDNRWHDLSPLQADLLPVHLPVACSAETIVAA